MTISPTLCNISHISCCSYLRCLVLQALIRKPGIVNKLQMFVPPGDKLLTIQNVWIIVQTFYKQMTKVLIFLLLFYGSALSAVLSAY